MDTQVLDSLLFFGIVNLFFLRERMSRTSIKRGEERNSGIPGAVKHVQRPCSRREDGRQRTQCNWNTENKGSLV